MKLGDKLKYARKVKDKTLQELADASGLSVSFLSDVEQGRSGLSVRSINKVAAALKIPPDYFIKEEYASIEELAEVSGYQIPDDALEYVVKEEKLPWVYLAKKLDEEGIPRELVESIILSYKAGKSTKS